jgi:hypothetical protein
VYADCFSVTHFRQTDSQLSRMQVLEEVHKASCFAVHFARSRVIWVLDFGRMVF